MGLFEMSDLDTLEETGVCVKCDLSGANLSGANMTGSNLIRANLRGANLTSANLTNARLDNTNLTGIIFCGTKMPDESFNDSGC